MLFIYLKDKINVLRPGTVTLSFTVLPLSKIGEANSNFSFFIFFSFFHQKNVLNNTSEQLPLIPSYNLGLIKAIG